MALIACKECGQEISGTAKSCPKCGAVPAPVAGTDLAALNFRDAPRTGDGPSTLGPA